MKRIISMLILAIVAIGLAPGVFAEENNTNSTTNETDIRPMHTAYGAEVRLLQLEKQLVRAKLHGEQVIEALEKQNASTGNLSGIVAEFEAMIIEVQEARADLNKTNNTENAVATFVALVHDARDLTKEFREAARTLIKDADKKQLKNDFEKIDRSELKDFDERIKHARREYNAENTKKMFEHAGMKADGDFEKRIKEGKISSDDLREEVKSRVRSLTPEEREAAIASLRDEAARARVNALARIQDAKTHLDEVEARYEARIKLLEEKGLLTASEHMKDNFERRFEMREKIEIRENGIRMKQETRMKDGILETRTRIKAGNDSSDEDSDGDDLDDADENETDDSGNDSESDMNETDEDTP